MSVSTKAHINPTFNVEDVVAFLSATDEVSKLDRREGVDSTHHVINFFLGDEQRMMHFHYGLGLFGSHLLSIGRWGAGPALVRDIVAAFSGIYIPDDCNEDGIEVFDDRDSCSASYCTAEAIFLLKWGITNRIISKSRTDDVVEAKKEFDRQYKRSV